MKTHLKEVAYFLPLIILCCYCTNQSFEISDSGQIIPDFGLLSPVDRLAGVEPGFEFKWGKSELAESYNLIIESHGHSVSFSNLIENSKSVDDLRYGTDYFWKVEGVNEKGEKATTPTFTFTTKVNFSILDEEFPMPQLETHRRISIYLPPDYHKSTKNYPVFYAHDGQDLFEARPGLQVDETLDSIYQETGSGIIVVGIDYSNERSAELSPWVSKGIYDEEFEGLGGKGDQYLAFIVETLKPFIDTHFRTISGPEQTGIMGFSLGGLISFYAILKYPGIFGKAGLLSPSFAFVDDKMFEYTMQNGHKLNNNHRIYFFAGGLEVWDQINFPEDNERMIEVLRSSGFENLMNYLLPNGEHNSATWSKVFPDMIEYLCLQ